MKEHQWIDLENKLQQDLSLKLEVEECIRDIACMVKPIVEEFREKYKRVDKRFIDRLNQVDNLRCYMVDKLDRKVLYICPFVFVGKSCAQDYLYLNIDKDNLTYKYIYDKILLYANGDAIRYIKEKMDALPDDLSKARQFYENLKDFSDKSNVFCLTSVLWKFESSLKEI